MIKERLKEKRAEFQEKYNTYYTHRNYNMSSWAYKRLKRITALILKLEVKK